MKANELRIGNWITFISENDMEQVEDIQTYDLDHAVINRVNIKDVAPIPLTEEWLLKMGLSKNGNLFSFNEEIQNACLGDLGKQCPSVFYNKRLERWMDPHTRVCFDYIHQLQNLFYCLTGTELTIKE